MSFIRNEVLNKSNTNKKGDWTNNSKVMTSSHHQYYFQRHLDRIFDNFDMDRNDVITKGEMTRAFKLLNMPISNRLVDEIFKACVSTDKYKITREEFRRYAKQQDEKLFRLFNESDTMGKGYLTFLEFEKLIKNINPGISDHSIEMLIKGINSSGDSRISYEEFIRFYFIVPIDCITDSFAFFNLSSTDNEGSFGFFDDFSSGELTPLLMQSCQAVGIITSKTVVAPLERAKIVAQADMQSTKMLTNLKVLYQIDGLRGFFRGNLTNTLKVIPEYAMRMFIFHNLLDIYSKTSDFPTIFERMMAVCVAGSLANFFVYPLELVRTRFAVSHGDAYKGIFDCFRKTYKEKRIVGMYRGAWASMLAVGPTSAVDLSMFLFLRDFYLEKVGTYPTTPEMIFLGAISGLISQTFTYPFTLVRTRLQNQSHTRPQYIGIFDCFSKVIKEEGVRSLYKGLLTSYMKSLPAICTCFTMFSVMRRVILQQGLTIE